MRTIALLFTAFLVHNLMFAQKPAVELFETDRFEISKEFEKFKMNKKFFYRVERIDGKNKVFYISNHQILIDSYIKEEDDFKGGISIYPEDFLLKVELQFDEPDLYDKSFKDFNFEDGKTKVTLVSHNGERFVGQDIVVADGFIVTRSKSETELSYESSLLLSKFYSIRFSMNHEFQNPDFTADAD